MTGLAKRDKRDTPKGVCHACHASTPQQSVTSHGLSRPVTLSRPHEFSTAAKDNGGLGNPFRQAPRSARQPANRPATDRTGSPTPRRPDSRARAIQMACPLSLQSGKDESDSADINCNPLIAMGFYQPAPQYPQPYPQIKREAPPLPHVTGGPGPSPSINGAATGYERRSPSCARLAADPTLPLPPGARVAWGVPLKFFYSSGRNVR